MNQKFTPPASARHKPREEYLNHPKFMELFGEAMVGVETPKDKISGWMRAQLTESLLDMSFPSLSVPFHIYAELCTLPCEEMTFGVLQKAADIIFSSKPNTSHSSILEAHLDKVKSMAELLDAMQQITNPIRDKVIDKLITADKIIK